MLLVKRDNAEHTHTHQDTHMRRYVSVMIFIVM